MNLRVEAKGDIVHEVQDGRTVRFVGSLDFWGETDNLSFKSQVRNGRLGRARAIPGSIVSVTRRDGGESFALGVDGTDGRGLWDRLFGRPDEQLVQLQIESVRTPPAVIAVHTDKDGRTSFGGQVTITPGGEATVLPGPRGIGEVTVRIV